MILTFTLFPYHLVGGSDAHAADSHYSVRRISADVLANVVLFAPLGFGLAAVAEHRRMARRVGFLLSLASTLGLSIGVEVLQAMIPTRTASVHDVVSNGVGGVIGYLCHVRWGPAILGWLCALIRNATGRLSVRWLTGSLFAYVSMTLLLPLPVLFWATGFSNWDGYFPLVVGNEPTGDHPWSGWIDRLEIVGRAISDGEARMVAANGALAPTDGALLARYDFQGQSPFEDHSGHLPDLVWRGRTVEASRRTGVTFAGGSWLESVEPATDLGRRLRRTRQFTVIVICAPANTLQRGPARIVTISSSPRARNFTIGQQGSDAIVRLRTPFTGGNGAPPELRVADVFEIGGLRQLIATYDGSILRLYVNGRAASASLHLDPDPRALLVGLLTPARPKTTWARVYSDPNNVRQDLALYYLATFVPLGCLLMIAKRRYGQTRSAVTMLLVSSLPILSLLLEWLISGLRGSAFSVGNVLLGFLLGGLPVFWLGWHAEPRIGRLPTRGCQPPIDSCT